MFLANSASAFGWAAKFYRSRHKWKTTYILKQWSLLVVIVIATVAVAVVVVIVIEFVDIVIVNTECM